ncbi:hypothetical protein GCM10008171_32540 [Methylopila jiangsuensis]|uniref:Uncharacterized protein n=1 Tax=Methylopila jiangsuensis TaxID=586230 RepID=A0A9W6JI09_9HYPH|nr:hypothetical protein [Methylopila jiangsuensis]MDR6284610.1 hypothetical protein [Methylopila jiangsuensis]GLK78000.1 hypothetical protein GCM10008171_32540 [Methylopila jiangsuensis]
MKKHTPTVSAHEGDRATSHVQRSAKDWKPEPSSLTREEMKAIVAEMLG